jgi:hypothetical protein
MSHITKIIICIVMNRARNKISSEIGKEQFVQDAGTRNAIYFWEWYERESHWDAERLVCFIDYTINKMDKVMHKELFNILDNLYLDGKD